MSMDKDIIWLIRGYQRKALFLKLPEKPFLSNKLRKELNEKSDMNLSLREVSRHLGNFKRKNLLKCLNSADPYNKVYMLTSKGKKIKEILFKIEI